MQKLTLTIAAAAVVALFTGSAWAQSSKFAAAWETDVVSVKAEIAYPDTDPTCTDEDSGAGTPGDPCVRAETTLATIDVPQWKDLLIGVSAQIGLVTLTQAKGKSTVAALGEALASAGVDVTLELREADPLSPGAGALVQIAAPGPVTFASRLQELKVGVDAELEVGDFVDVLVSLKLETTAAHHFNFIGVDLDQGDYDVVAVFDLSAFVAIVGEDALAEAEVILGPRIVTAQEVRGAKGSLVAFD